MPLTEASAAALRTRIGWIGQKPHVFAGSVQTNVALGRAGVGAAQVRDAMCFAALAEVGQADPAAALGEGGSGLSGGEAVRLALARVVVHPRADLLLVDEPTAHLDTETARRVVDALMELGARQDPDRRNPRSAAGRAHGTRRAARSDAGQGGRMSLLGQPPPLEASLRAPR